MSALFRRRLGAALCSAFTLLLLAGTPATAQEQEDSRWRRKQTPDADIARRPRAGPKTLERHANALEHLFEERYVEARQELDKIYFKRLNPVEQAMIHQDYAYVASAEAAATEDAIEARQKRDEARQRFQAAIDSGGMYEEAKDARYKIAMLYMQDEAWKESSETLEQWFSEEPEPNPAAFYILALTYYQQERYEDALVPATKSLEMSEAPKESWLQLVLGIHLLRKDYASAIPIVEELLALYPKRDYFLNLSTVYGALGSYEDAAVPLQLAYEQGLLTEDDHLQRLGQLLMFLNLPYRAAKVFDQGLAEQRIDPDSEALAMLSNSWIAAREYEFAVDPLERAASLSEDGELYVRLAQVHVQRENWDGATDALRRALEKGDLAQPGNAHLLMGIALYSDGKPAEARRWFGTAKGFDATEREASVWIGHIDQELAAAASGEAERASGG